MLTISISESLSMAPESWSEWNSGANNEMYMTGLECLDSTVEQMDQTEAYTPWGLTNLESLHHGNNFDIWKPQPDENLGKPLWTTDMPSFVPQDQTVASETPWQVLPSDDWQAPQKLKLANGAGIAGPTSSWASPLRVPLPDPVVEVEEKELDEEPLAVPSSSSPGLAAFAKAVPWAVASDEAVQSVILKESAGYLQAPPGLAAEASRPAASQTSLPPAADVELPPGISIATADVAGSDCTRVEWRIEDLYGKLQASMGRPLVSPPFAALGLPNLRLMVFPDGRDTMKNARSGERKGLYAAMIKKGPLHGALKLKADCLQCATVMTVNLTVGKVRSGPLVYDFSEQAIHGLDDFGVDWLKQVDKASGSLTVGLEILDVRSLKQ
eukprot:TRINITY_DN76131_c0_g1_i1.p1 TRINITY_DN76131_c0_g1~~TRINITY_DN76131_c0_g1_i1.p1  ORF type:complete len:383 (+),score=95.34 TRINITY_DN76131_c0_g1_i1:111-1259(+)